MIDFNATHLQLFGLPQQYGIDLNMLESRYRELQTKAHPDRFAGEDEAQIRLAEQWSGRINEAYRVLKSPFERGCYLLTLQGIEPFGQNQPAMPPDFLMQQMEWHEQLAEARSKADKLMQLEQSVERHKKSLLADLSGTVDSSAEQAALILRKLKFLFRLEEQVGEALEALE